MRRGYGCSRVVALGFALTICDSGCGSGGSHRNLDGPASASSDVAALVTAAERELVVARTLDYRAPRQDVRGDAYNRAAAQLFEACKLGDTRACWRGVEMDGRGTGHQLPSAAYRRMAVELGRVCLRGGAMGAMSCRALASRTVRGWQLADDEGIAETKDLCHQGLAAACEGVGRYFLNAPAQRMPWLRKGCDLGDAISCESLADALAETGGASADIEAIRRRADERSEVECGQGFTASCGRLVEFRGRDPRRYDAAAQEGCMAGLDASCSSLTASDDPSLRAHGLEWMCSVRGSLCATLAGSRTDPAGIRDAWEHGCQLGGISDCLSLLKLYRAGSIPEPVPGRADALADFLCRERASAQEACALARK